MLDRLRDKSFNASDGTDPGADFDGFVNELRMPGSDLSTVSICLGFMDGCAQESRARNETDP